MILGKSLYYMTCLLILLAGGVVVVYTHEQAVKTQYSQAIPQQLPDFLLKDTVTGNTLKSKDFINKKYLLNVWGTWCFACQREHDYLVEMAQRGITIIGLNYKDDITAANNWLNTQGNPYQHNLFDGQGVLGDLLAINGAPETYFVNTLGEIKYVHIGVVTEELWNKKLLPIYQSLK